jgi:isoleucyl-tRNA synthetase
VDSDPVLIGADDVIVTQTPRAGWAVATDAGETVAIDITITPELRREGLAREVIRLVQDARKNDGLDVTDRISLRWLASDPDVAAALTEHAGLVAGEVLAVEYVSGAGVSGAGVSGAGVSGAGVSGAGVSGAGVSGAGVSGSAGSAGGGAGVFGDEVEHADPDLGLTFWLRRVRG